VAVPRLGPNQDYGLYVEAMRIAAREASLVWICNPNNPTGRAERPGTIERLLDGIAADAASDLRPLPAVAIDEAYAEFSGQTALPLLDTYPGLVIVRTASKAYGLAGLRVGFGLARRETLEYIEPYRPPGSVSTVSATVVTAALRDREALEANIERIETERFRLLARLGGLGWKVDPSVTNFLLVDFGTPERAERTADGLLRRGLVPRTFGQGHPLNAFLRFTVRAVPENDRLIAAAREIGAEESAA
jgi:histidinol-phosphate aminotransferase